MQTKNTLGNLKNRYKAVLEKCNLLNTFGSLAKVGAIVGMLTTSLCANTLMPKNAEAFTLPTGYFFTTEQVQAGKSYLSTFSITENNVITEYGFLYEAPSGNTSDSIGIIIPELSGATYTIGTTLTLPPNPSSPLDFTVDGTTYYVNTTNTSQKRIVNTLPHNGVGTSSDPLAFYSHATTDAGGAIGNKQTLPDAHIYADFFKNDATGYGGAIYNAGTMGNINANFIANTTAENSSEASSGGAIYNAGTMGNINANFIANTADLGGAIFNNLNSTISDVTATFIANTAFGSFGGAIYNDSTMGNITATFIANTANEGGAIFNDDKLGNITATFIANTASSGNGGAIINSGTMGNINANFINNIARNHGGAIGTSTDLTFLADTQINIFSGNTDSSGSNAIFVTIVNVPVTLNFNMTGNGGFLMNDSIRGNNGVYTVAIRGDNTNNVFYLNNSIDDKGSVTLQDATLQFGSVTHTHNGTATTYNGSVQNLSTSGTSIISGNAIINGTANIDGTTSFTGATTFANTANFASSAITTFASSSTLIVDANAFTNTSVLSGSNTALNVESGAKIQVANGAVGDVIQIADGFVNPTSSIATNAWEGENLTSTSSLQALKVADFDPTIGTYSIELLSLFPSDVNKLLQDYALMDRESAELLVEFSRLNPNVKSSETFKNLFARIFDSTYIGDTNPWLAIVTAEGLLQLGISAGTASTALNINGITFKNLHARLNAYFSGESQTIAYYDDNSHTNQGVSAQGISAGSEQNPIKNGLAVWATPFYGNADINNFKAGAFDSGYESNLGGLSFGVDYSFNNMYRLGLAINGGGGSSSSNGDFNKTSNDFGFVGASLYGAMYYNNFILSADLGYTFVNNDIEMSLPTALGYSKADADMDSNIFTIGAEASYLYETQLLDIMPYLGLRYTNVYSSAYDVKVSGSTVVNTESDSQNIFSIPMGISFAKEFNTANNWNIKPSLDLGLTYSFGDLEATSTSSIPTVVGSATYNVENVDRFAFNGGLGLEIAKNNLSFALNYDLQASEHETSHAINANFTYKF